MTKAFSTLQARILTVIVLAAAACAVVRPALARPALLFDAETGVVHYAEDQDDLWYPASLTKMMTAYLTFEALKQGKITLDTKLTQSELSNSQPPSKIGLPVGAQMDVELALQALVIKSANDVAVMLAEGIAGSHDDFVNLMNATAKRLGMTRTRFFNPNGLPAPEQVTTARDLAKLTLALLTEYPQYAPIWGMRDFRVGRIPIRTHNALLKVYDGADGMKTGFTCDSGYNVVATATREGHRLVAVVLGQASGHERNLRAANLLEHGFQYRVWQEALRPVTVSTLEQPDDAKATPTSVRDTVLGYACGGRKRPPAVAKAVRQKRMEAAKQRAAATAEAKTADPKATTAPSTAASGSAQAASPPKAAAAPAAKAPATKSAN